MNKLLSKFQGGAIFLTLGRYPINYCLRLFPIFYLLFLCHYFAPKTTLLMLSLSLSPSQKGYWFHPTRTLIHWHHDMFLSQIKTLLQIWLPLFWQAVTAQLHHRCVCCTTITSHTAWNCHLSWPGLGEKNFPLFSCVHLFWNVCDSV